MMNKKDVQELNYLRGEVKSLNAELVEQRTATSRAAEEKAVEAAERLTSLTASYEGLETAYEELKERFAKVDREREKLEMLCGMFSRRELRRHDSDKDALESENEQLKKRLIEVEAERDDLQIDLHAKGHIDDC